jgi:hypothetical protein
MALRQPGRPMGQLELGTARHDWALQSTKAGILPLGKPLVRAAAQPTRHTQVNMGDREKGRGNGARHCRPHLCKSALDPKARLRLRPSAVVLRLAACAAAVGFVAPGAVVLARGAGNTVLSRGFAAALGTVAAPGRDIGTRAAGLWLCAVVTEGLPLGSDLGGAGGGCTARGADGGGGIAAASDERATKGV